MSPKCNLCTTFTTLPVLFSITFTTNRKIQIYGTPSTVSGAQVRDRSSTGATRARNARKGEAVKVNVLCGSTSLLNPKPSIYSALARLLGSQPLSSALAEGRYANERRSSATIADRFDRNKSSPVDMKVPKGK